MRKLFSLIAGFVVLFFLMACAGHDVRPTGHPEQVVEKANQHLPQIVDSVIKLEKISRNGSVLTYHFVIDLEASELSKEYWQRALYERAENACNIDNRTHFAVIFEEFDCIYYDFRDKDGETLVLTKVDRNSCY
jgi:hypothetical protein